MKSRLSISHLFFSLFALICLFALTAPASAADLVVTRYFSGLWDQPKQENQGIMLQIIDHDIAVKRVVAYWLTYGDNLDSAWFIGIGQVEGPLIVLELYTLSGIGFMQDDVPDIENVEPAGNMVLAFSNCNHGTASFELAGADPSSGEFEIKKLAGLYNSRCSGGISDDTPGNARPVQMEVALEPAREEIAGRGKAKFWERADRSDFHVSAEDIPDGDYALWVLCPDAVDNPVGTLTVTLGEGGIQFRSPESNGKQLLTFDPRPCLIELRDAEGAVLTSGDARLAEKVTGNADGGHGNGMTKISVELDNVDGPPGASGEASYSVKNNSAEFEVEVEQLPVGTYILLVNDIDQGKIEVTGNDNRTKGRIRFSDPQKEDRMLLEFVPLGQLIEVIEQGGADPILEAYFPDPDA